MSTPNATILIVDDCLPIAEVIARHLQTASYRTIVAGSGEDACSVLTRTTPDCIVLDLMMPGMTGTEFLHGLRRDPKTAAIPVVLASARVGHGTHLSTQLDAEYAVGKPFSRVQIIEAVRTAMARKRDVELALDGAVI